MTVGVFNCLYFCCGGSCFCGVFFQARLDQSKVSLEALEKQLEEEKLKVKSKETLGGVATGKNSFIPFCFDFSSPQEVWCVCSLTCLIQNKRFVSLAPPEGTEHMSYKICIASWPLGGS